MKTMGKTIFHRAWGAVVVPGIALAFLTLPCASRADIYQWEDDSGVMHFTDDIGNIPPKYRAHQKPILKGPPSAGKPSVSTVESPPAVTSRPPPPPPPGATSEPAGQSAMERSREAEALRAKIAAKEQFVETIDRKRSNILNPMGNRFVSPEDLELYGKYNQELPQDRQRLRELEAANP